MSAVNPVPAGCHTVQPYLMVQGAVAAIEFYAKALNATEQLCMKDASGRVVHAELQMGDSRIMLADENPDLGAYSPLHYGGSSVGFMLYVPDCDGLYRQALGAGATSESEPVDQPYGVRMGGIRDPFGYKWFLGTQIKEMAKEELEALPE